GFSFIFHRKPDDGFGSGGADEEPAIFFIHADAMIGSRMPLYAELCHRVPYRNHRSLLVFRREPLPSHEMAGIIKHQLRESALLAEHLGELRRSQYRIRDMDAVAVDVLPARLASEKRIALFHEIPDECASDRSDVYGAPRSLHYVPYGKRSFDRRDDF